MSVTLESPVNTEGALLQRLALDITRKCQAQCTQCYNHSGPQGTHGEMTREDWLSLLDQGAAAGVRQVQMIGGEPTLHPHLGALINRAVDHGFAVEVFSNLILVPKALWPVLQQRGVTLATSYYSDQAEEHEAITKRRGSYRKTRANIELALRYGIPVRAAIIDVNEGQRVQQAIAELREMGVTHIGTDRVRGIGRGTSTGSDTHQLSQLSELCGYCAQGRAAVLPNGDVAGCVMSGGMMTAGNVRTTPLSEILTSPEWAALAAAIPQPRGTAHDACLPTDPCVPDYTCLPNGCSPDSDGCQPHLPGSVSASAEGCNPDVDGCSPDDKDDRRPSAGQPDQCEPTTYDCAPKYECAPNGCSPDVVIKGGCTPDEDSCQPSPGVGRPVRELAYTATACNPDQDGSDCAPAETEACGPSY